MRRPRPQGDAHTKVGNNDIRRCVLGTEENVLLSIHKPRVRFKDLAEGLKVVDKRRRNVFDIAVDDAVGVQVLHAGQDESGYNRPALLSAGEK